MFSYRKYGKSYKCPRSCSARLRDYSRPPSTIFVSLAKKFYFSPSKLSPPFLFLPSSHLQIIKWPIVATRGAFVRAIWRCNLRSNEIHSTGRSGKWWGNNHNFFVSINLHSLFHNVKSSCSAFKLFRVTPAWWKNPKRRIIEGNLCPSVLGAIDAQTRYLPTTQLALFSFFLFFFRLFFRTRQKSATSRRGEPTDTDSADRHSSVAHAASLSLSLTLTFPARMARSPNTPTFARHRQPTTI